MIDTEERIKKIDTEIEILNHKRKSFDETWDFSKDFFEYEVALEPITSKIEKLDREKRLVQKYTLKPINKHCDIMTIEEFIDSVKSGWFIDYDGSGNYAFLNEESDISIYPSDVKYNSIRKDFTHVIWYNR